MRYQQKDFTQELKTKIQEKEAVLKEHSELLLKENKSIFEHKNLEFEAAVDTVGSNHFQPGYCSTVSIGVSDNIDLNGELMNLHLITIWECHRSILGLPISKNIPGSKITGEFLDESLEEIKEEMKEYIEELLSEDY